MFPYSPKGKKWSVQIHVCMYMYLYTYTHTHTPLCTLIAYTNPQVSYSSLSNCLNYKISLKIQWKVQIKLSLRDVTAPMYLSCTGRAITVGRRLLWKLFACPVVHILAWHRHSRTQFLFSTAPSSLIHWLLWNKNSAAHFLHYRFLLWQSQFQI